jgi:ferredoxin--NADP+ reductase
MTVSPHKGKMMHRIISKEQLSPTIARLTVEAPLVAHKRKPGNFVIVRLDETGERIPLTIVDADESAGTITLIVQAIGKTTQALCAKSEGETIADVAGPLGNPTPIVENKRVVCVGGGVGTAELFPIARALKENHNFIYTIVGARTKDLLILEDEMQRHSDHLALVTDDGSFGRKGVVTDELRDILKQDQSIEIVYAIGPLPMMKAVSAVTREFGVHTVVSLNAIMVDGTGMCGGCRVTIDGEMKFACVDGPEFDGHKVNFDELMLRNRTYVEEERESIRVQTQCASHSIEKVA